MIRIVALFLVVSNVVFCRAPAGDEETWVWPPVPPATEQADIICRALGEQDCSATADCVAEYGPSTCTPEGVCTADVVFHYCRADPVGDR